MKKLTTLKRHWAAFLLVAAWAFLISMSLFYTPTPDGANPRLAKMETKYFLIISHTPLFKLKSDGELLCKQDEIYSAYIDYYTEKIFHWMLNEDPFIKEIGIRIGEKALIKKFTICFYGDENEMKNEYVEYTNVYAKGHHNYLAYPPRAVGFCCVYTPGVIFATVVSSNLYQINNPKAKSKALDAGYINKLADKFREWNLGELK